MNTLVVCDECNGWLNPALAADSAVRRGDEVLLIQRKFPPMQGAWAFPGGFVDRGEDPHDAALRELQEETGLIGTDAKLLMVMGDPDRDPRKHIVSIVYEIEVTEDQIPQAGDDAQDARFWPIETLLAGEVEFAGDHLTILKKWLNR